MKKIFSFILAVVMTVSTCTVAFADYRGAVDGLELKSGFNPVVRVSENSFDYVIYAYDMTGMTNGDFTVIYDTSAFTLNSVKQTGNYTNSVYNDVDGCIYFSYLYSETNTSTAVKMYILNFSINNTVINYPEIKVTNVAGTFIKSEKDTQIVEATEDNAAISEGTDKDDNYMQDDEEYYKGDVNGDGVVTPADARLVLRHAARLELLYLEQLIFADFDNDGKITPADARMVLRKAAGLIN